MNEKTATRRPSAPAAHGGISDPLVQRLISHGKVQARDVERVMAAQAEMGGHIQDVFVALGLVSELDMAQTIAEVLELDFLPYDSYPAVLPELSQLPAQYLRENHILPLQVDASQLTVVMADPHNGFLIKSLQLATGLHIKPCVGLASDIRKALSVSEDPASTDNDSAAGDNGEFVEHLKDLASEAPVIRLVNQIIGRVIDLRASDIHLEPFEDGLHVRYRVDGEIAQYDQIAAGRSAAVCSRIKLLAHLDIAERRLPQDGRIKTRVKGHELDLRISTLPTMYGESLVMRVLDRSSVQYSLAQMGFLPGVLEQFNQLLHKPHGILLVTGPTGSGKTTTLYAALASQDANAQKIITVEEPVEYQLDGINQMQVNTPIGLSFARALRSILRQDPDTIMIGEMRDGETAQIAVQAALTGHLVLSTLHTNTAAGAITRLQDMGIERYLITSSVNGVLSQRLLRTLCPSCKSPETPSHETLQRTGLARHLAAGQPIYKAVGCAQCRNTGYHGRTGIHELLVMNDALRRRVLAGADATELHAAALSMGMNSLNDDGLQKVAMGQTSLDELLRVTEKPEDA